MTRTWTPQPQAEAFVQARLAAALAAVPEAARYAEALRTTTGVRLRDILDHLVLPADAVAQARSLGWVPEGDALTNPLGFFPTVLEGAPSLAFRVESLARFQAATGTDAAIDGAEHGPLRLADAFTGGGWTVRAVERAGGLGHTPEALPAASIRAGRLHLQIFRTRRRRFEGVEEGLAHTEALVDAAVADIGPHRACHLWFTAEREYWMSRCPAGRVQAERQNRAGIGWSNIDHHTYDGSRQHFAATIRILEKLGYELREMLYAGALAGWGSQILEQPALKSTIFADVDLAPHETDVDFAHQPLPPLDKHRRAGIISIMHGESILEGGLNHVAGMYDQRALRQILAEAGQGVMAPFSDFPFLYQELTTGDVAAVEPARLDALEAGGHLSPAEAEDIRLGGTIAAHLENLERNDGYKGFNMPGIDGVLRKLDPRKDVSAAA